MSTRSGQSLALGCLQTVVKRTVPPGGGTTAGGGGTSSALLPVPTNP